MHKDRKFVGQPVFAQILDLIPTALIYKANREHKANRYYKKIPLRVHLVSLLFGVYSYCNGLRELCEGLLACEGRLQHLGFDKAPARSTLSDANTNRSFRVFETIYQELLKEYHRFISDSRLKGLSIRNLKIIDSTSIQLFSEILRGVGRKPHTGSTRKGGLKVHSMMNAFSGVAEFVRMTEAREHDSKFLLHLNPVANSWLVFDKAYIVYEQFAKWTKSKIWFVTRMKNNADYRVSKVLVDNTKKKKRKGILKEEYITVSFKQTNKSPERLKLR